MKKRPGILPLILLLSAAVFALNAQDGGTEGTRYIPLLGYDYLSLDRQSIRSPGLGMAVTAGEELLIVGLYQTHIFEESLGFDYPEIYHSFNFLCDRRKNRHNYLLIFKSESDKPVAGGIRTFQGGAVYGYELIRTREVSLILGGGLAAGDFGMELPGGSPWSLLPVPLVRFKHRSEWFASSFEFLTNPNFEFVVAPEKRIRLTADLRMDQFRDIRDLIFDCALHYRFFSKEHPMGDFAGIAAGVKNDAYGFDLEDGKLDVHSYAVYGMLNLSILQISGGYAFAGRIMYEEECKRSLGDGFFVSLRGMYQF